MYDWSEVFRHYPKVSKESKSKVIHSFKSDP